MLVLIFEDEEDAARAKGLNWSYANIIENTPYEEVTEVLDKLK